jgi:hypothetical protein
MAMIRLLRQFNDPQADPLRAIRAASRDSPDIAAIAAHYLQNE